MSSSTNTRRRPAQSTNPVDSPTLVTVTQTSLEHTSLRHLHTLTTVPPFVNTAFTSETAIVRPHPDSRHATGLLPLALRRTSRTFATQALVDTAALSCPPSGPDGPVHAALLARHSAVLASSHFEPSFYTRAPSCRCYFRP